MSERDLAEGHTIKSLHTRIQILEVVTLLSLVLNLALWYFVGHVNAKVDDTQPQAVAAQR